MKVGSLFSGIGGLDLGLEWAGMETVWQSEVDEFCRGVLRRHFSRATLYGDVNEIDPSELAPVDLICGGFPCQPVSLAGKRKGYGDKRWLWPTMFDIIRHHRPAWILGENTPGLISLGLDGILADLETEGYACRTFIVPACAVNAPHRRDRVFIVAHSISRGLNPGGASEPKQESRSALASDTNQDGLAESESVGRRARFCESGKKSGEGSISTNGSGVGNARSAGPQGGEQQGACDNERKWTKAHGPIAKPGDPFTHWDGTETIQCHDGKERRTKPGLGLLAHGVPGRVARLKALGNAVVPQVAHRIGHAIMAAEQSQRLENG